MNPLESDSGLFYSEGTPDVLGSSFLTDRPLLGSTMSPDITGYVGYYADFGCDADVGFEWWTA